MGWWACERRRERTAGCFKVNNLQQVDAKACLNLYQVQLVANRRVYCQQKFEHSREGFS